MSSCWEQSKKRAFPEMMTTMATMTVSSFIPENASFWDSLNIVNNLSDWYTAWSNFTMDLYNLKIVLESSDSTTRPLNTSYLEHAPYLTGGVFLKAIVLGIMTIVSLLANAATIYSVTKNVRIQHNWTAVYTLILHLSIADLLVTIFCIGGEAVWSYTVAWIWGNAACKIFKFLQVFSLYLSTFVLVLIGLDRFLAVRYPMKSLNTSHRCQRLIIIVWILSAILAIPQVIIFHVARGPFVEEFTQCVTHGFYTAVWQEQLYAILSIFFMFLLPLVILLSTYVSTVITIARSERMFKMELVGNAYGRINSDINRQRLIHRAKTKSLRISVVIVAAFVIWWTPYYTMMIIFMFLNPDRHLSEDLQNGIFFFGMSNSLVNPLIYGAFHLWPQRRKKHNSRDVSLRNRRTTSINGISTTPRGSSDARMPFLDRHTPDSAITVTSKC